MNGRLLLVRDRLVVAVSNLGRRVLGVTGNERAVFALDAAYRPVAGRRVRTRRRRSGHEWRQQRAGEHEPAHPATRRALHRHGGLPSLVFGEPAAATAVIKLATAGGSVVIRFPYALCHITP